MKVHHVHALAELIDRVKVKNGPRKRLSVAEKTGSQNDGYLPENGAAREEAPSC